MARTASYLPLFISCGRSVFVRAHSPRTQSYDSPSNCEELRQVEHVTRAKQEVWWDNKKKIIAIIGNQCTIKIG